MQESFFPSFLRRPICGRTRLVDGYNHSLLSWLDFRIHEGAREREREKGKGMQTLKLSLMAVKQIRLSSQQAIRDLPDLVKQ